MVLSDLLSLLGIVLVTVVFIIMLSIIKERPENNIGSERLQLNTETALLNFLRTPAPHLQGIGGDYGDTLTMADLIVLATYNNDYKDLFEAEAEKVFNQRYHEFWSLDTESQLYTNYGFGHSYFWDSASTYAENIGMNLGRNVIGYKGIGAVYQPPVNIKATSTIYLQGMDGGPIEVTLSSWLLFSGIP